MVLVGDGSFLVCGADPEDAFFLLRNLIQAAESQVTLGSPNS